MHSMSDMTNSHNLTAFDSHWFLSHNSNINNTLTGAIVRSECMTFMPKCSVLLSLSSPLILSHCLGILCPMSDQSAWTSEITSITQSLVNYCNRKLLAVRLCDSCGNFPQQRIAVKIYAKVDMRLSVKQDPSSQQAYLAPDQGTVM